VMFFGVLSLEASFFEGEELNRFRSCVEWETAGDLIGEGLDDDTFSGDLEFE